ncbi:queuosine precursor transporter [Methylovorus glucosotrophus]|uniref:Probable queuosine precursor transporter n=1 Tax=Methylovorus glucosotrophus (strain SIP3-4) TaxID=582744 RepID=C6XCE1_METGS|nr:queuosine precursor transporter [Methylovorus glucosotrophus]ACT50216.1 conserved hypothetical protein [Methylovorus glucosotrophus SIP3-4]
MQTTRSYRYYDLMMAAFVTVLVCSNLIGPAKISQIDVPVLGTLTFGAGLLFFPISFIFGDILTEVYGYSRSRKVIWAGFAGLAFASFMAWMIVALPAAPFWHNQEAYEVAFGSAWRVSLASLVAFAAGEFVNSYIMAKMKVMTAGRWLWMRTIGSTIFGEGVDSALFYPLAFYGSGVIPDDKLPLVMLAQFVAKVGVEVVFTPVTYKVVAWLKRAENEDYYDRHTDFNPFALKTDT